MVFKEISKEEFNEFAKNHSQNSILQSQAQAELYEYQNIEYKIYALLEGEEILFAGLYNFYRTARFLKSGVCYFGPIGDYDNFEAYTIYHQELVKALKKAGVYKLRIFPKIIAQERDIDGHVVEGGENNLDLVSSFEALGYEHFGFNQGMEEQLIRYYFIKDIQNISNDDDLMQSFPHRGTPYAIRRSQDNGIQVRELAYEEVDVLYDILKTIHEEKGSPVIPLKNLQNIYRVHHPRQTARFMVAELDIKEYQDRILASISEQEAEIEEFNQRIAAGNAGRKTKNRKNEAEIILRKDHERLEELKDYQKYARDGKLVLSAGLFYIFGDQVVHYYGGNTEGLEEFYGSYALHWEMLSWAIQQSQIKYYNFYGTLGEFCGEDGGIHRFKAGFGGVIEEYLGAFDLPIKPMFFKLFKLVKGRK